MSHYSIYDLWFQEEFVLETYKQRRGTDFEGRNVWNLLHCWCVCFEQHCVPLHACICVWETNFSCELASKVLLKLCVPHNSVFSVYTVYRWDTHFILAPCISFPKASMNVKNKKASEQPEAVIMSLFIRKIRPGLFRGGCRNLREKKGQ